MTHRNHTRRLTRLLLACLVLFVLPEPLSHYWRRTNSSTWPSCSRAACELVSSPTTDGHPSWGWLIMAEAATHSDKGNAGSGTPRATDTLELSAQAPPGPDTTTSDDATPAPPSSTPPSPPLDSTEGGGTLDDNDDYRELADLSAPVGVGGASAGHGRRHGPAYERAMRALRFYNTHIIPERQVVRKRTPPSPTGETHTPSPGRDSRRAADDDTPSDSAGSLTASHTSTGTATTGGASTAPDTVPRGGGRDGTGVTSSRDPSNPPRSTHSTLFGPSLEDHLRRFTAFSQGTTPSVAESPLTGSATANPAHVPSLKRVTTPTDHLLTFVRENDGLEADAYDGDTDDDSVDDDDELPPEEAQQMHATLREFILEMSLREAHRELNLSVTSKSPFSSFDGTTPKKEGTGAPTADDIPAPFRPGNFSFDTFEWIHCLPLLPIYPVRYALSHLHQSADADSMLTLLYAPNLFPETDYGAWLRLFTYLAVTLNVNGIPTQTDMYKIGVVYTMTERDVNDGGSPAWDPTAHKEAPIAPQCALLHNRTLAAEAGVPVFSKEEREVMKRISGRVGVIDSFYPSWQKMAHGYWTTVIPAAECLMKTTYHYDMACIRARLLANLEAEKTRAHQPTRPHPDTPTAAAARGASPRWHATEDDSEEARTTPSATTRAPPSSRPPVPTPQVSRPASSGESGWWQRVTQRWRPQPPVTAGKTGTQHDDPPTSASANVDAAAEASLRWQRREGRYREFWRRAREEANHDEPLLLSVALSDPTKTDTSNFSDAHNMNRSQATSGNASSSGGDGVGARGPSASRPLAADDADRGEEQVTGVRTDVPGTHVPVDDGTLLLTSVGGMLHKGLNSLNRARLTGDEEGMPATDGRDARRQANTLAAGTPQFLSLRDQRTSREASEVRAEREAAPPTSPSSSAVSSAQTLVSDSTTATHRDGTSHLEVERAATSASAESARPSPSSVRARHAASDSGPMVTDSGENNPPLPVFSTASPDEAARDEAAATLLQRVHPLTDTATATSTTNSTADGASNTDTLTMARALEVREQLRQVLLESRHWTQRRWRLEAAILIHVIAVEGASMVFPSLFFPWQSDSALLCSNLTWTREEVMLACGGANDILCFHALFFAARQHVAAPNATVTSVMSGVTMSEQEEYVYNYVTNLVVNYISRHHLPCHAVGLSFSRCYGPPVADPVSALEMLHKTLYVLRQSQSRLARKMFSLSQIFKYSLVPSTVGVLTPFDRVGYSSEWTYTGVRATAPAQDGEGENRADSRATASADPSTQDPTSAFVVADAATTTDATLADVITEFDTKRTIPQGQTFLPLVAHNQAYYYEKQMRVYLGDESDENSLTANRIHTLGQAVGENYVDEKIEMDSVAPLWGMLHRRTKETTTAVGASASPRTNTALAGEVTAQDGATVEAEAVAAWYQERPDQSGNVGAPPSAPSSSLPDDDAVKVIYASDHLRAPTPLAAEEVHSMLRGGTTASYATILRGRSPVLFFPYLQGSRPFWLPRAVLDAAIRLRDHVRAGTHAQFTSAASVAHWNATRHSHPALPPFLRLFMLEAHRLEAEAPGARAEREAMYQTEMLRWIEARHRRRRHLYCGTDKVTTPHSDTDDDIGGRRRRPHRTAGTRDASPASTTTTTWRMFSNTQMPARAGAAPTASQGGTAGHHNDTVHTAEPAVGEGSFGVNNTKCAYKDTEDMVKHLDAVHAASTELRLMPLKRTQYFFEHDRFFLMDPLRFVESSPLFLSVFLRTPVELEQDGLINPLTWLVGSLSEELVTLMRADLTSVLNTSSSPPTSSSASLPTSPDGQSPAARVRELLKQFDEARESKATAHTQRQATHRAEATRTDNDDDDEVPHLTTAFDLPFATQQALTQAWSSLAYAPRRNSHFLGVLRDPLLVAYTHRGREHKAVVNDRLRRRAAKARAVRLANGTATEEDLESTGPWTPPLLSETENAALVLYLHLNGTAERFFRQHPVNERRCRMSARLQLAKQLSREARMILLNATSLDRRDHATNRIIEDIWRALRMRRDIYHSIAHASVEPTAADAHTTSP